MPAAEPPVLALNPYLAAAMLVVDVLEWTGVIPDPLSLILSLFSGRPKEEATAQVADWLMKSVNVASRIWGLEIARYLNETGAVLSDGHPAVQAQFYAYRTQFVSNLTRQGVSTPRANAIATQAYSRQSQAGGPYPPELTHQIPNGWTIGGPQPINDLFAKGLQLGESRGLTGTKLNRFATQYTLEHATLTELWKIKVGDPQKCGSGSTYDWNTDTCITGSPIPTCPTGFLWDPTTQQCIPAGPPPQCPTGYTWDPVSQSCQPTTTIPPPQCPPGMHWDPILKQCVPDITPPGGDDDPDELGDLLGCLCPSLTSIASTLVELVTLLQNQAGGGNGQNAQCCANLVAELQNIVSAIAAVANSSGTTVDLTEVVLALQGVSLQISNIPTAIASAGAGLNTTLDNDLGAIANAIANAPPTDVSAIVDQLKLIVKEGDVKQPIIDWLTQQGFLDPQLAQLTHGADWADVIFAHIRTMFWTGLSNWWKTIGGTGYTATFKPLPLSQTIANDISGAISAALSAGAEPVYPVIKGVVDAVVAILNPSHPPLPADIGVDPDLILSKTLAPALIINGVALLASYFGWEISEQLREYVDITTAFVGLEEVKELKVGARMRNGPAKVAELQAKALYRQELPGFSTMAGLAAQGLYNTARAHALRPLTGLPDEFEAPLTAAAYRGLNPRQILRLIETNLFTQADITDELTFSGMRAASQHRMLVAAPYLATASERSSARSALESAYVAGLLTDNDLCNQILSLEQNTDLCSLVLTRVHAQKLVAETKALESEYTTLFLAGLLPDATYRNYLSGIGLQPDMVNIVASKAEARANATIRRKELADLARLERETASIERRTAIKNFIDGNIQLPSLVGALVLTGLTTTQAAAWADLAALQKAGGMRWIYGLQLSADAAGLLHSRVTALSDQRKKQLITDAQYVNALQALNIPANYINALRATADAMLKPATAAILIPVSTS